MKSNLPFLQEVYNAMELSIGSWQPHEQKMAPRLYASLVRKVLFMNVVELSVMQPDGSLRHFESVTSARCVINKALECDQEEPIIPTTPLDFAESNSFIGFFDLVEKQWHTCDVMDIKVLISKEHVENPDFNKVSMTPDQLVEAVTQSVGLV